MSFNKRIIPETKVLKTFLKENGSSQFYWRYIRNVDAFMGDSDGIDFVEKFAKKYFSKDGEALDFREVD